MTIRQGVGHAAIVCLFLLFVVIRVNAAPLNIHVKFTWLDKRGCCNGEVLRLVIDGDRVFASSVMLQNYSDLESNYNRAIDLNATWKCADHTQDRSAPDPRGWG